MRGALVLGRAGPLVVLTSYDSLEHPSVLARLAAKGVSKFIAFEIDVKLLRNRYGEHFEIVREDLHETDDLRVLDFDGTRAFKLIPFTALGRAIIHEEVQAVV